MDEYHLVLNVDYFPDAFNVMSSPSCHITDIAKDNFSHDDASTLSWIFLKIKKPGYLNIIVAESKTEEDYL